MLVDLQRVTGGGKVTVEIYWMDSWGREQSRKEILLEMWLVLDGFAPL